MELEALKPYRVTKGNTDGNIIKGDVLWKSENGMLNIVGESAGFLSKEDLTPEILDFEAVFDSGYEIITTKYTETLVRLP